MGKKKIDLASIIKKNGVAMVFPESEYLNNERITIHIYKRHFTAEQWQEIKKALNL